MDTRIVSSIVYVSGSTRAVLIGISSSRWQTARIIPQNVERATRRGDRTHDARALPRSATLRAVGHGSAFERFAHGQPLAGMMAPRRLALLRLAPLMSAPMRSALLGSVPTSVAPLRSVCVSLRNGLGSSL